MAAIPSHRLPCYYATAVIVVADCLACIVNFGVRSGFGLFTSPISDAHQWPREIYSFAMAVQNLLLGITTPIAGAMAGRQGRRPSASSGW